MKTLLLFCFLSFGLFLKAQTKKSILIQEIYSNWLKHYHKGVEKCDTFFYAASIDDYSITILQEQFSEGKTIYSKQDTLNAYKINFTLKERNFITRKLGRLNSKKWNDRLFPNSKVVSAEQIDAIQESAVNRNLAPALRLCYTVYTFSDPIFLRNDTVCLFYSGKTNFAVKEGELCVFKKRGAQWIKFATIYDWIE
jgi:hypothetical protein